MPDAHFDFTVTHTDGGARRGVLTTAHGVVQTPAFMPVGTQGVVKSLTFEQLQGLGAEIMLSNTYHLYLRPGDDLIARLGGLHGFSGWTRPILTDSGGYQVFSLAERRKIDEQGAHFKSHLDGSAHLLTPEKATDIQAQLGSDIAMVLDECLAHPSDVAAARISMERTLRWARRARERMLELRSVPVAGVTVSNPGQAQFGIVQGSVYPDLRQESAAATVAIGFEAYAVGGLSVGEPPEVMYEMVGVTTPCLPADRPRYLMGAGTPDDLVEAVARGVADHADAVQQAGGVEMGEVRHQPASGVQGLRRSSRVAPSASWKRNVMLVWAWVQGASASAASATVSGAFTALPFPASRGKSAQRALRGRAACR